MIALSLIIPLYNTRDYIVRCLDSVYSAEVDESLFEVIVVNDGSTDGGEELAEQYAQKKPNLRVIHQENRGLSGARNQGMSEAQGRYLYFLDSDDTLSGFKTIFEKAQTAQEELVVFAGEIVDESGNQLKRLDRHLPKQGTHFTVESYMSQATPQTVVWLSLYQAAFLRKRMILFMDRMLSEDIYFTLVVLAHNPTIQVVRRVVYRYLERGNSITQLRSLEQKLKIQNHSLHQLAIIFRQLDKAQIALIQRKLDYCAVDLLVNVIRYDLPHEAYVALLAQLKLLHLYPLRRRWGYPLKYRLFRYAANHPQLYWIIKRLYNEIFA